MSKYSFTDDLVNSRGEVVVSTKCFIPNYIVDEIKSDGYEQGKADGIRKFAEWLSEVTTFDCRYCQLVHDCNKEEYKNCVGRLIAEYEKEQKNE